ncbi:threonine ammonia-lyase [Sinanaerobacter chloroacetimidivorans]|jgi:threonine dehydratase|uniref:L-threonine dehydratase catabolic TdcB n=1 Tax=Sinanaerobacter chloroacetimidivorans TaxID=2818044 RepID=A0A8J8B2L3_9FIRM|nr:threonine ammonia-lyase [Sinanaerobacter chloroacetimidivorans]MBR0598852.1 threonine ammonia-lyase [Sinanaerobacter chloroacetimidivorans]
MNADQVNYYLGLDHKEHILKAQESLNGVIKKTPLIYSDFYSKEYGCNVYIKPENFQITGSFKIRGAYNKINNLTEEESRNGIICSSAGNHAQGVAFSAQKKNLKSTIVMPNVTPLLKVDATKAYGSEVVIHGDVYDEAYGKAMALANEYGYTFVHAFDDYDVICGQGTIGLEILEELDGIDEILIPIGGGGLISGIAMAVKAVKPEVKVIGVVPVGAMAMKISIDEGQLTRLASVKTSAEGVAVRQPGDLTFALAKKYVDEIITVTEKDIMEAVLLTLEKHKMIAETAGVVPLAGLKKRAKPGKNIVCLVSGGNIDVVTISSIINQGMISRGRIMCFAVELPDKPGQLVKVAQLLAENGANVIELVHNQFKAIDRYSNKVALEVTVETNGHNHIKQIMEALEDNNFTVNRVY